MIRAGSELMLLLVCILLTATRAIAIVVELNDNNFQRTVNDEVFSVVVFHAPWCHHCHDYISNIFEPAAAMMESEDITMATLDIEEAKEVQSKYVIKQVPSIRLFRKGQMFPYNGPGQHGTLTDLVQYLKDEMNKRGLEENPVITLTNDNFDDIIMTSPLILVEFYSDMCVPCQRLEPIFADSARQLLKETPPIKLGCVQIPDQMEVAKRFPLEGYPLLIMFRYGMQYNYTGPKESSDGIVEYMRKQSGPSSILLERAEDIKKFINTREISVVAYFHDNHDSILLNEYLESGNMVRNEMNLGHCMKEGVAHQMKQTTGTIVIYHPIHLISQYYESGYSIITSPPANATELHLLYLEHARPLVGEMTHRNYDNMYIHRPLLLAYYEVDWSHDGFKATQYWHDMIAAVANKFRGSDIVFAVANEEDYPDDLRSLDLSDWGEDVSVGLFAPGPLKYSMTEELTPDTLTDFIQTFLDGELMPRFNSEPVPKPVKGALIRKVVGSTYTEEVGNIKKNVMIMLCIPSLPECKDGSEYYYRLATQFKGVKDLVFAEMNIALNDPPPGTPVRPFPMFLFSSQGSDDVIQVTPQPKDEADLAFFLKYKQNIKPLRSKVKSRGKNEL